MEKIYGNMFYNSGWRSLLRENDVNTDLNHEKSVANDKGPPENNNKKTAENKAEENNTLIMLSKISADIGELINQLSEQSEKIDRLLSILEGGETPDKKGPLDSRKSGLRRHFPFLDSFHASER